MAVFSYKATTLERLSVQGTIAADSPRQARDVLRGQGLTVRELHDQTRTRRDVWFPWRSGRGHGARLAATVRELATLLAVGIPLTEAIDTLARQHRGGFRTALQRLGDRVASGA